MLGTAGHDGLGRLPTMDASSMDGWRYLATTTDMSRDVDNVSPPGRAREQRVERPGEPVECDLVGNGAEVARFHVRRQTAPDLDADIHRAHCGIDADEGNTSQDERHDRGPQLDAAGQPRAGDSAPVVCRPREPRQKIAARGIDRAGPPGRF